MTEKALKKILIPEPIETNSGFSKILDIKRALLEEFITVELSKEIKQASKRLIYKHLCNFFSKFYKRGEFRFNSDYIILPYKGEETLFYWPTYDLYYIGNIKLNKRKNIDFFIHKNLEAFLKRELDFYIKHEVLGLDEVLDENKVKERITEAKVIKNIAEKVIAFLAHIENFQKRLWEKRKFVLRTDYVLTLDRIPEPVRDEILDNLLTNDAQIAEWRELLALDDLLNGKPLSWEFLEAHPTLYLDTKHLPPELKDKLLASFDDLDEATQGIMIKSENWQALNLLLGKYREKVQTIYIDPPYNTGSDEFLFKDRYQHSSWLSMMCNSLRLGREILQNNGAIYVSIGDKDELHRESCNLIKLLDQIFGFVNWLNTFSVETANQSETIFTIRNKEYLCVYAKNRPDFNPNFPEKIQEARCTTSNLDQTMPIIEFPKGIEVEGIPDGEYTQKDFYEPNSKENIEFIEPKILVVKNKTTLHPIKMKARWSNPGDLKKFFEGNPITKFGKEITKVVFRKSSKGKILRIIAIKRGFKKPNSIISFTQIGSSFLYSLFGKEKIKESAEKIHPKPLSLIQWIVSVSCTSKNQLIDFFAGSGTTAHAVLRLNKEDGGERRYMLVEIGDWFETVMVPRIKKVMFSDNWKNGKPQKTNGVFDGHSHMFKYQYLEQYEDTLDNIEFKREGLNLYARQDYLLTYMLDFETQGSPCKLSPEALTDPFNYKLRIRRKDGDYDEVAVDLVETFNYLMGIHVKGLRRFKDGERPYRVVLGERENKRVAVIWRPTKGMTEEDYKREREFLAGQLNDLNKCDEIYTNADSTLDRAQSLDPLFMEKMWEGLN